MSTPWSSLVRLPSRRPLLLSLFLCLLLLAVALVASTFLAPPAPPASTLASAPPASALPACQAPLLSHPTAPVLDRTNLAHPTPIPAIGDPISYFAAFTLAANEINSVAPILRRSSAKSASATQSFPLIRAHLDCATKYLQQFSASPTPAIAAHAQATLADLAQLNSLMSYVLTHPADQVVANSSKTTAQLLAPLKQRQASIKLLSQKIPAQVMPALSMVVRCDPSGVCQTILDATQRHALLTTWGAILDEQGIITHAQADRVSLFLQDPAVKSVFAFSLPAGQLSVSQSP